MQDKLLYFSNISLKILSYFYIFFGISVTNNEMPDWNI